MPKSGLTAIKEIIANNLSDLTWTERKTPPPRTRNYSTYFTAQYGIFWLEFEWRSNGWGSGQVIIHLRDLDGENAILYNLHTITDDTYKLTKEFLQDFVKRLDIAVYLCFDIDSLEKEIGVFYQEKLTEQLKKNRR